MSRYRLALLAAVCLVISMIAVSEGFSVWRRVTNTRVAAQSACTPPLYQGYPSSCSAINLRWLNRDPISSIDHYEIYRGGIKVGEVGGNAISYSDLVGCSFGSSYQIKQVMKSGASCTTNTTGNQPHTKPCDMCLGGGPVVNVVSSASFGSPVAPGSIATVFANPGQNLTSATAAAGNLPLPTALGGTQVLVNGQPANLFYVSPTQINFLLPQTGIGAVNVVVNGASGERTEGNMLAGPNPAIFTADSSGKGVAAALITADGQNYQRIYDGNKNAVPISVSNGGRPNFVILFGTGIRNQGPVEVKIGGQASTVAYAGPHPSMPGVDQINAQIPQSLRGVGPVLITVTTGGFIANFSQINIGN